MMRRFRERDAFDAAFRGYFMSVAQVRTSEGYTDRCMRKENREESVYRTNRIRGGLFWQNSEHIPVHILGFLVKV